VDVGWNERVRAALEEVGLAAESATNPYDLGYSRRKLLALGIGSGDADADPGFSTSRPRARMLGEWLRVREVAARAAGEGRTVIAISHDMHFVAESFRRVW